MPPLQTGCLENLGDTINGSSCTFLPQRSENQAPAIRYLMFCHSGQFKHKTNVKKTLCFHVFSQNLKNSRRCRLVFWKRGGGGGAVGQMNPATAGPCREATKSIARNDLTCTNSPQPRRSSNQTLTRVMRKSQAAMGVVQGSSSGDYH